MELHPLATRFAAVADGFHWFDPQPALAEIRRVLRSGGGLAVLGTFPDWEGASWGHELGTLINELRPEHPYFDGPPWQAAVAEAAGWSAPREFRVTVSRPADPERIVDLLTSMSWLAAMEEEERNEALARVRSLIGSGETPDKLPVHFAIGLSTPT